MPASITDSILDVSILKGYYVFHAAKIQYIFIFQHTGGYFYEQILFMGIVGRIAV